MTELLLVAAAVATGLQAGTYYAWACGVMPGLARVDDRTFVHTIQQVNLAIVNPVFLVTFLGAPVLAVASVVVASGPPRPWAAVGAATAVATAVITLSGNIPLNNAIADAAPDAEEAHLAAARSGFERRWARLNALRAVTSTVSLVAMGVAGLRA